MATGDVDTGKIAIGKAAPKARSKALPDGLKVWLIASLVVLLSSLILFVGNIVAGFIYFTEKTPPLWVTVLGVLAVLGMAASFAGLCLVFLLAVLKARREDKAQVVEQQ